MPNPKVSVIVPIYKVEKYLIECIDSILNQTLKDIEVILVDEGDLDECRAIIDMYEFGPKKDERVRTIHEKNGGYGASCNKGFDIATGEYISIIESDDFIAPEMYEEMYDYAKKLDADVVKTPYYDYWEKQSGMDELSKMCGWYELVSNTPENQVFSIEQYPSFLSIHPSIWAALYKTAYIKDKNIRCIEARGAGYVDNHFRIQTLCQTDRIAWKNKAYNYYRLSNPNASQALLNVSTFIQRWNDVHKFIEEKLQDKWNIIAPYCLCEENINTFYRLYAENYSITEKDFGLLKENLSYWTDEQILNAKHVSKKDALKILNMKHNSNVLLKYVNLKNKSRNILSIFGIPLLTVNYTKRNTTCIKLFKVLLLKIKKRTDRMYKIYLFGFIPIARYEKK